MRGIFLFFLATFFSAQLLAFENPKLFLKYARTFDRDCSQISHYKIKPEVAQEALNRNVEFQKAWDGEAEALFQTLFRMVGKGSSRKEMTVSTSVCVFRSVSDIFLVNIRPFLRSYSAPMEPAPLIGFVETTFHEYLHNYLVENLDFQNSALLKKYKDETLTVRVHLHLMAITKLIYTDLKREDLLNWAATRNQQIGGDYLRAWQIATEIEKPEDFLADLKAHPLRQKFVP